MARSTSFRPRWTVSPFAIALASGALLPLAARPAAAHRLEPINTDYAQPFAPGVGTFRLGYGRDAFDGPTGDSLEGELEIGVVPRWQATIGQGFRWENADHHRQRSGFENLELGARYLLAGGKGHAWGVSINPSFSPVTGSRAVREGVSHYGASLNVDYTRGPWIFVSNFGFDQGSAAEEDGRARDLFYRFAVVHTEGKRWNPTLELLGDQDLEGGAHNLTLVPEIQYYKSGWTELKLGVPVKLTHGAGRLGIQVTAQFSIGKGSHGE